MKWKETQFSFFNIYFFLPVNKPFCGRSVKWTKETQWVSEKRERDRKKKEVLPLQHKELSLVLGKRSSGQLGRGERKTRSAWSKLFLFPSTLCLPVCQWIFMFERQLCTFCFLHYYYCHWLTFFQLNPVSVWRRRLRRNRVQLVNGNRPSLTRNRFQSPWHYCQTVNVLFLLSILEFQYWEVKASFDLLCIGLIIVTKEDKPQQKHQDKMG